MATKNNLFIKLILSLAIILLMTVILPKDAFAGCAGSPPCKCCNVGKDDCGNGCTWASCCPADCGYHGDHIWECLSTEWGCCSSDNGNGPSGPSGGWTKLHIMFKKDGAYVRERYFTESGCEHAEQLNDLYLNSVQVKEGDSWQDPNKEVWRPCLKHVSPPAPHTIPEHQSTDLEPREWQIDIHPPSGHTCAWQFRKEFGQPNPDQTGSDCGDISLSSVPVHDRVNLLVNLAAEPTPTPTPTPTQRPTPTPRPPTPDWFQTEGGNVYGEKDIKSFLPSAIPPKYFSRDGDGGFPGIVACGDFLGPQPWGQGEVSSMDWLLENSPFQGKLPVRRKLYDYSYFQAKLDIPAENIIGQSAILDGTSLDGKNLSSDDLWQVEGNLTVNSLADNLNEKVFLVQNNLIINNDFNHQNTLPVFIVKGAIEIKPAVHSLGGVFISDEEIKTGQVKEDDNLTIYGSAISWGEVSLKRKRFDNSQPAEVFIFNPEVFIRLASILGKSSYTWQELAP